MLTQRAQKLKDALGPGFEAALVQTTANKFYLLDFDAGDAGTLLVLPDRLVYFIDSRYIEAAQRDICHAEVVPEKDALAQVAQLLEQQGAKRLYMEDKITVAQCRRAEKKLAGTELDAGPALSEALAGLRAIKDEEEQARMRQAQRITDACFAHILPFIKEGVREVDLMLEMEHYMRANGAQQVAFDTICVAGPNTSLPHGVPGEYRIKPGDFITFDFGAKYKGYCTDMTRTVALGQPDAEQRKVYELVLRAHLAGIAAAGPGKTASAVDKTARDMIYAAGYEGRFGHGLGHAVGIEIHEEPRFSPACNATIAAGMMMTVEPGCYLPGRFGVRIEDTVLITPNGCEPLPQSPKELLVL